MNKSYGAVLFPEYFVWGNRGGQFTKLTEIYMFLKYNFDFIQL
jgi:hypothetical protein